MIFEKLTPNEQEMIAEWFLENGSFDKDNPGPETPLPLRYILRSWESEKERYLYTMFNQQLILEKEVCYVKSEEALGRELIAALRDDGEMSEFKAQVLQQFRPHSEEWYNARDLFYFKYLLENKYEFYNSRTFVFNDTSITIKSGMKPMRALKKIANILGLEEDYEKFRLAHSMILNQKVVRGTLCLSIHPFDYVTMSDNGYGWDSCMSWKERGGYRMGTVEMMNSSCVVVAYLKGDKPFKFNEHQWPGNKKWRQLMIVHPTAICNIKEYPYQNEDLTSFALQWLADLARTNLNWNIPYPAQHFRMDQQFIYHDQLTYRFEFITDTMYNDFNHEDTHHLIYIPQGWQESKVNHKYIHISGAQICSWCGKQVFQEEGAEGQVLCDACECVQRCASCGCLLSEDDRYWGIDDECYCEHCYSNIFTSDALDNEPLFYDDAEKVYLSRQDDLIDICADMYILVDPEKLEDDEPSEPLFKFFKTGQVRRGVYRRTYGDYPFYYVNISDCTAEGLILFGLYSDQDQKQYQEDRPSYYSPLPTFPI